MSKNIQDAIVSTQGFFRSKFGIDLTEERARDTVERIAGVFLTLDKWSRETSIVTWHFFAEEVYTVELKCEFACARAK